ncbi:dCTP deaminase, partial [Candidatus Parvarchaeota archaeon]|nr:dCTP deaminase [Candidatus Acidifodinimicrobium mancum]
MILGDKDIKEALNKGEIKIDPLHEDTIRENGVDLRLGRDFIRLRNFKGDIYDSKSKTGEFPKEETDEFVIEPNERILTVTEEDISISNNLVGFVNLRSSYARVGIIIP